MGIVNATVYKTETLFTCLGHGKSSTFLKLQYHILTIPFYQFHLRGYVIQILLFNSLRPRDAYMRRWTGSSLAPGRRQVIICTNAGILLIGPLGTNFSENLIAILTFLFTKMRLKVSSAKWRPFCLGLNVLIHLERNSQMWVVVSHWVISNFVVVFFASRTGTTIPIRIHFFSCSCPSWCCWRYENITDIHGG